MSLIVPEDKMKKISGILSDPKYPMGERFRALFTLRNIGGDKSIEAIGDVLKSDESVLLKHECGYCLGQMQDVHANQILIHVLSDLNEHPMVRHECGEALGAIGDESVKPILEKFSNDSKPEVAETCQLAIKRIEWLNEEKKKKKEMSNGSGELNEIPTFNSVDPAPPLSCQSSSQSISQLQNILTDSKCDLFERYRAMFALRNINTNESALALTQGLKCPDSALFRHEIAYVLGQIQNPITVEQLTLSLEDPDENEMVRHECAEALGSIATQEANEVLKKFAQDDQRVVRESVEVALDISDYTTSDNFQYADGLNKV